MVQVRPKTFLGLGTFVKLFITDCIPCPLFKLYVKTTMAITHISQSIASLGDAHKEVMNESAIAWRIS